MPDERTINKECIARVDGVKSIFAIPSSLYAKFRSFFIIAISYIGRYDIIASDTLDFLNSGMCTMTAMFGDEELITSICLNMTYDQKVMFDKIAKEKTIFSSFSCDNEDGVADVVISCIPKDNTRNFSSYEDCIYLENQTTYTYKRMSAAERKLTR